VSQRHALHARARARYTLTHRACTHSFGGAPQEFFDIGLNEKAPLKTHAGVMNSGREAEDERRKHTGSDHACKRTGYHGRDYLGKEHHTCCGFDSSKCHLNCTGHVCMNNMRDLFQFASNTAKQVFTPKRQV